MEDKSDQAAQWPSGGTGSEAMTGHSATEDRRSKMPLVDLHTDALYEHIKGRKDILARSDKGHLDIPRMREANVTGQVFVVDGGASL